MSKSTEVGIKAFMKKNKKIPVLNLNLEYVTTDEYAKLIKRHPVTVNDWLREGKIEGAIKVEGRWRIPVIPKVDSVEPITKLISEDYGRLLLENEELKSLLMKAQKLFSPAL